MKNRGLRGRLVRWVEDHYHGEPILGASVVDAVKVAAALDGVLTTGEVLAKELRIAVRQGQLAKSYLNTNNNRFVRYAPIDKGAEKTVDI